MNALDLSAVRANLNKTLGPVTATAAIAPAGASPFLSAPAVNLSDSGPTPRRVWDEALVGPLA